MRSLSFSVLLSLLALGTSAARANASTIVYTDLASWQSAIFNEQVFLTTRSNVELAQEVPSPVVSGLTYGDTWTFDSASTGLGFGFQVKALANDGPPGLAWLDALAPGSGAFGDSIHFTVGDNDDWELSLLGQFVMWSFAFELRDDEQFAGENISLLAADGSLLEVISLTGVLPELGQPGYSPYRFLGIVSSRPFAAVRFDEADESSGDDIGIANLRFGNVTPVPEPSTWLLLGTGLVALAARRRLSKRA